MPSGRIAGDRNVRNALLKEFRLHRAEYGIGASDDRRGPPRCRRVRHEGGHHAHGMGTRWGIDHEASAESGEVHDRESAVVEVTDSPFAKGVPVRRWPPWQRLHQDRLRVSVTSDGSDDVRCADDGVESVEVVE
ncbi:MAG: hypothetical protein HGA51_05365 [Demequinaceae bacterium]|nr:hypothetical protein [Demequinaceae bacterium]